MTTPAHDFDYGRPATDLEAIKREIADRMMFTVGKDPETASDVDWLHAAAYATRDLLVERWMRTARAKRAQDVKHIYYMSMEFLMGRTLGNAMITLGITPVVRQALAEMGVQLDRLAPLEPDAALGNGGLGRLAACFLESMATLGVPGYGYGIRYDYGMFRQTIRDGQQVEVPDDWLRETNPWEFPRPEVVYPVRFGGHVMRHGECCQWMGATEVLAMAYDTIVPGYETESTNTLRLWSAKTSADFDLRAFNRGDYIGAVEHKTRAENVSRVLYPDDSTPSGRELRLRQEYFFVSASVQDLVRRYLATHADFDAFPSKVGIHLNDTHPVLAIPELVRLLVDEHQMALADAWGICRQVFSYTNHTLMHEALETWPVDLLSRVLPRHLQIIFDINAQFLTDVHRRGDDHDLARRVSLVDEQGERRVRMAYLAVLASHSVNGVSELHSRLMRESIFADFAYLWPERFNNKTNGVTQRRWLALANPELSAVLDAELGCGWRRDLGVLARLRQRCDDPALIAGFRAAKLANKRRLAAWVGEHLGVRLSEHALFDVHVKRIHEYKRQLLNVLHVVTRYLRILDEPGRVAVPRVVIFSGKAASAYHTAKLIIRLIHDVARTVNDDARVGDLLRVVFIPNYGVSLAELIIPAADLSEQISTAGTEASGTGNMKLALNGALTIGTLDGANVEILDAVGADNIFIFGNTAPEVEALRRSGYQPDRVIAEHPELGRTLEAIRDGRFNPDEPQRYRPIYDLLVSWGDHYQLLADYPSYVQAQERVDALWQTPEDWARRALCNVAGMGPFSSDRTIAEYVEQIWHCGRLEL